MPATHAKIQKNPVNVPNNLMSQVSKALDAAVGLHQKGKLGEAERIYRNILSLEPRNATALHLLGVVAAQTDHADAAVSLIGRAIKINRSVAEYHANHGNALRMLTRLNEAIAAYRQAIQLAPNYAEAWYNMGMAELLAGNFSEGWAHYEWRWKTGPPHIPRNFAVPQWRGEPLNGRRILLYAEQGLGDTMQFVRYVPLVRGAGGEVILEAQSRLLPLLSELADGCKLVARGETLPDFDLACPLMSLPLAFGTSIETIPKNVPYLSIPADLAESYSQLSCIDERLRVGICWAGNPSHSSDRNRSMHLSYLKPILEMKQLQCFSFQMGKAAEQLDELSARIDGDLPITNLEDPPSASFVETAAKFANVDLILTVDTSIAHLAGALNKPVWLLLAYDPDWRWMLKSTDSPWYPSMRIYRQPCIQDWASVIRQVKDDLTSFANELTMAGVTND